MILLDTHVWVWWVSDPSRLSRAASEAIDEAKRTADLLVSSISVWEVALLVSRRRLTLSLEMEDWMVQNEALPVLRFIPVDNHVARRSVTLPPPLHADPADRMIAATALTRGIPLVTRDSRLRRYEPIETIW